MYAAWMLELLSCYGRPPCPSLHDHINRCHLAADYAQLGGESRGPSIFGRRGLSSAVAPAQAHQCSSCSGSMSSRARAATASCWRFLRCSGFVCWLRLRPFGAFAFWLRLRFVRVGCVCVLRVGCVLDVSQFAVWCSGCALKRVCVVVAFWFAFRNPAFAFCVSAFRNCG